MPLERYAYTCTKVICDTVNSGFSILYLQIKICTLYSSFDIRRSIGSILKDDFNLKVFSRNGTSNKREILNFVFNIQGDLSLTEWMNKSLVVGYWEDKNKIPYTHLRELEEQVIKVLKTNT